MGRLFKSIAHKALTHAVFYSPDLARAAKETDWAAFRETAQVPSGHVFGERGGSKGK